MNYLTRYYKNLSEQLQEQLTELQNLQELSNETLLRYLEAATRDIENNRGNAEKRIKRTKGIGAASRAFRRNQQRSNPDQSLDAAAAEWAAAKRRALGLAEPGGRGKPSGVDIGFDKQDWYGNPKFMG